MNKLGIHYGSFVKTWNDDQRPLIKKVKSLGFDLLEFGYSFLLNMSHEERQAFGNEAREEGITLALSMGLSPQQDIGSPDADYRNAGLKILTDTAKAMGEVGITDCSGIIHGSWNGKIDSYDEKAGYWKQSVSTMKEAAKVFNDQNVFFNIEVVNRFENFLINTCEEALLYIDDVDSPTLGVHLDTFHMNIEEDSMVTPIIKAGDKLRYFHIGENNRKFPGLGTMPWKIIFDTLKAAGYERPISMEPFVRPGGEVGSAISLYRELMDLSNYENDIRQSLAFVKALLA